MSSPLAQLHADLLWAAQHGGEMAGEAAVQAGVHHADSGPRALANVETVNASYAGPMEAHVVASQPAGVSSRGPNLPGSSSLADEMAEAAVRVGKAAAMGAKK